MTRWTRARVEVDCGRCGEPIYVGQPLFVWQIRGLHRPLLRCWICAPEPAPADLPELLSPPAPEPTPQRFWTVAQFVANYSRREWWEL